MYIKQVNIKNFRIIEDLQIHFNNGLNIIIGENNSGKTAVIDALRLVFEESNNPRSIYWNESDFKIYEDGTIKPIELDIIFSCNEEEMVWFNELHVVDNKDDNNLKHQLELHFKIDLIEHNGVKKIKRTVWGGKDRENRLPFEVLSSLNAIYLSALRDVNRDLKPNPRNLLKHFFSNIVLSEDNIENENKKKQLLKIFIDTLENEKWEDFVSNGKSMIKNHLDEMQLLDKEQDIDIVFSSFSFDDLVQKLIIQVPVDFNVELNETEYEQQYLNIYQNGLGYNNLIYASTVFGDIIQRNTYFKEEFNILLIEEPEAHLHPQLQNTFFEYLNKLDSNKDFQILVTSHSPIITAKNNLKNLIILKNNNGNIVASHLNNFNLNEENLRFLKKFLDVTKSQLFFSNGVILVEGISEALLLPIFSSIMGENYNIEKNGVEVIISGTSFSHYAKLFNSENENERLNFRCAILTDDDIKPSEEKQLNNRVINIENEIGGNINMFIADYTFEYELFKKNEDLVKKVYKEMHNRTEIKDGMDFIEKLVNNKDKSEFALNLSYELQNMKINKDEIVPKYIQDAIKFVVDGKNGD